jgi:hypothetical protein
LPEETQFLKTDSERPNPPSKLIRHASLIKGFTHIEKYVIKKGALAGVTESHTTDWSPTSRKPNKHLLEERATDEGINAFDTVAVVRP